MKLPALPDVDPAVEAASLAAPVTVIPTGALAADAAGAGRPRAVVVERTASAEAS